MKYIFYGCGVSARYLKYVCESLKDMQANKSMNEVLTDCGVIAFCDSSSSWWGRKHQGINVISPEDIARLEYDSIIVLSFTSADLIFHSLIEKYGVPPQKINVQIANQVGRARKRFVYDYADFLKQRGIFGNVAEGGVYQGYFSRVLNDAFPESNLYLFDTFEGFDESDISKDTQYSNYLSSTGHKFSHFQNTSVDLVMSKLPYPEKAIIKKGYFPASAEDVNDKFIFVNLDFDLYTPIKAGLEFFYPKMVSGGVILVHDYFSKEIFDVHKAVDEFCAQNNLFPLSVGDILSVAIVKQ